jgi:DNA-binding beta-propeller fold protein YncE
VASPSSTRAVASAALSAIALALGVLSCDTNTNSDVPAVLLVSLDSIPLARFDSVTLTASVLDKDSTLITGVAVSFRSADTTIARVSNLGVVRSVGPTGKTSITVSGGGLARIIPVTVTGIPQSVSALPADTAVHQGAVYQLRTAVLDAFGDSVANITRAFASGDSQVATISVSGMVSAKKPGQALLTVSAGVLTGYATVTVLDSNILARIPLADSPYGVAASAGGVVYVTPIVGPAVRRVDLTTHTLTDSIPIGGEPAQVTFNGAGTVAFATKRAAGSVAIIDVATHSQMDTIAVPGNPYAIRVSTDGDTAYVISTAGWLYKIDVASRTRVDSIPASDPSLQLTLGPGDSLLYFSSQFAGTVTEVRATTMAVTRTFPIGGRPQGLAVSLDGAELYVADETGPLRIWSLTSGTEVDTVSTGGGTFGVALTPDGTKLYVGTSLGTIRLITRATRALIYRSVVGGTPRLIAVDPITGHAVVPNEAGGWVDVLR